jgi:subtilisin family serine protease
MASRDDRSSREAFADDAQPRTRAEVYRRLAVRFEPGDGPSGPFLQVLADLGISDQPAGRISPGGLNIQVFSAPSTAAAAEAVVRLNATAGAGKWMYAEVDQPIRPLATADPRFDEQWAWRRMDAVTGWDCGRTAGSVKVAIVDSGLASHQDLNLVSAVGDRDGHGTLLAGTVGAIADNDLGGAGAASPVKLIGVAFFDVDTWPTALGAVAAIDAAVLQGATIINASWDVARGSQALRDMIADVGQSNGALVVAAAGNDGTDNDRYPIFPASYDLPNLISVMATDEKDDAASFSNFGLRSVHVAAPGVRILSTHPYRLPTPRRPYTAYRFYTGTSPAAAHVTGLAALLKHRNPGWTPKLLREHVMASVDPVPALRKKCASGGRVSFRRALCSPLKVLKPQAGDQPTKGSLIQVFWENEYKTPACRTLTIQVKEVGGSSWQTLATGVRNDGDFRVRLPGVAMPKARLRIRSEQGAFEARSGIFKIKP